jgi:DNA-binding NarL/FixJ family response regulator
MLERQGFEVVDEAQDGTQAAELAGKHKPDVAILDLFMPHLNGFAAAREIRRLTPETSLILMTRSDEAHYVAAALREGFKGYVVKGDAADHLVRAINDVIAGQVYLSPRALENVHHQQPIRSARAHRIRA